MISWSPAVINQNSTPLIAINHSHIPMNNHMCLHQRSDALVGPHARRSLSHFGASQSCFLITMTLCVCVLFHMSCCYVGHTHISIRFGHVTKGPTSEPFGCCFVFYPFPTNVQPPKTTTTISIQICDGIMLFMLSGSANVVQSDRGEACRLRLE